MPTYEYVCRVCEHRFDIVQKMSDDPLVICPECGGELRKVFAPPAIAFKGSGFYATDHGKKTKTSADAGGGGGGGGGEAKPSEPTSGTKEKKAEKKDTAAKPSTKEQSS